MSNELKKGIIAATPIAVGFIPIAITFGVIAQSIGLTLIQTMSMSMIVFAGASQFVAVNLLALGVPYAEIILTTFMLNFRHFLMSSFLITKFKPMSKGKLALVGFGITDETFSLASLREEKLSTSFLLGLNFTSYSAWVIGSGLGVILSTGIPPALKASMGIALYAMFIGLLVPSMKKSTKISLIAVASGLTNIVLHQHLTDGWSIIISTLVGALLGVVLFMREDT